MPKAYNPDYHSQVVRNLRDGYAKRFGVSLTRLTDKQIWDIYEEYGLCQDDDHPNDADYTTYEVLNDHEKAPL